MKNNYIDILSKHACAILLNTKDKNNKVLVFTASLNATMKEPVVVGVSFDEPDIYFVGKPTYVSTTMTEVFKDIISAVYGDSKLKKYTDTQVLKKWPLPAKFSEVVSDCNEDFYKKTDKKPAFKVLPENTLIKILDDAGIKHDDYTYTGISISNESDIEVTTPLMGEKNWKGNYKVIPKSIQDTLMDFKEATKDKSFEGTEFEAVEENFIDGSYKHIVLVSNTGVGKSTFCEYLAAKYEIPCMEFTFDETLDPERVLGHDILENGSIKYVPGILDELVQYPVTIFLHELNRAKPILFSNVIRMCDDTPYYITNDGVKHPKHPQARIIITVNPSDTNPENYDLPNAINSRMNCIKLQDLTTEQVVTRLQSIFHSGNTNLIEAIVEASNKMNKELRLQGAEFLVDYRKLQQIVKLVLNKAKLNKKITKERFELELTNAFLCGNASNQSELITQLSGVVHNLTSPIYEAYMLGNASNKTTEDEADYIDVIITDDEDLLNKDFSEFEADTADIEEA